MPDITLAIIALLGLLPINFVLRKHLPRRRGTLRPSTLWLALGISLSGVAVLAITKLEMQIWHNKLLLIVIGVGAIASIGFYFHRRVHVRQKGIWDTHWGRVRGVAPWRTVKACHLGENVTNRALIITTVNRREIALPGAVGHQQLQEAVLRMKAAGVSLPRAEVLKARLGLSLTGPQDQQHIMRIED